MKNHFLLSLFLLLSLFSCGQGKNETKTKTQTTGQNSIQSEGITFETDIDIAFQKANETGKAVFVECYSPNCPICMSLEPTLKNPEVGKFYNDNFISYKLNVEDAAQVAFLNKKGIFLPGFPLFFYFDKDQNIIHLTDPKNTPADIIQHAKTALNPNEQSGSFWKKYEAGDRDQNRLISLAYLLRVKQDTTKNDLVTNTLYQSFPKNELGGKLSWSIAKKCIMNIDNGFAQYWLNNINKAKAIETEEGHPGNENNTLGRIIQGAIYAPKASEYSLSKVNQLKHYMTLVGASQYITNATWHIECPAILREQGEDKAFNFLKNLIAPQTAPQMLVYYASFYNTNFPSAKYASNVRQWLVKAKPLLQTEQEIANLYYESARLYKKSGDLVNAKKEIAAAKTSINLAKTKVSDANLMKVVENINNNIDKLAAEL